MAITPHKVKETVSLTDELLLSLDLDVIHGSCNGSNVWIGSLGNCEKQWSCIRLTAVHTSLSCNQVCLCKTHVPRIVQEGGETSVADELSQPVLSCVLESGNRIVIVDPVDTDIIRSESEEVSPMLGRNYRCSGIVITEPQIVVEWSTESVITVDSRLEVYKTFENRLVVADLSPWCKVLVSRNQRVRTVVDNLLGSWVSKVIITLVKSNLSLQELSSPVVHVTGVLVLWKKAESCGDVVFDLSVSFCNGASRKSCLWWRNRLGDQNCSKRSSAVELVRSTIQSCNVEVAECPYCICLSEIVVLDAHLFSRNFKSVYILDDGICPGNGYVEVSPQSEVWILWRVVVVWVSDVGTLAGYQQVTSNVTHLNHVVSEYSIVFQLRIHTVNGNTGIFKSCKCVLGNYCVCRFLVQESLAVRKGNGKYCNK